MNDGTFRTSISIRRSLKARMNAVTAQVNWSAVAADAFERKIQEVEAETTAQMDNLRWVAYRDEVESAMSKPA
jgi:hypothetical protein